MTKKNQPSRRQFLKTSTAAATATLLATGGVYAAGGDTIKVGLIGCGGRGKGAGENVLQSAKGVEIVAIGDYFEKDEDRGVEPAREFLLSLNDNARVKELGNKVDLPKDRCHVGLDAYEKVIATPGVNYIILATSPGFRPLHIAAAIEAGKNVFTEKPVGVDGPGIRRVLEAEKESRTKKLGIGAGTQRRHQTGYLETMKRIHDGAIGDIVNARCYWNGGNIWFRPRQDGMTDLDYQIHNWYHFGWLCGDHIVEQHVHNIDVVQWALGNKHPVRALGMGGRVRPYKNPNVDGNIYNFFAIDFEYPNNVHVLSMCRQVNGTDGSTDPRHVSGISEALVGTKGMCMTADRREYRIIGGDKEWAFRPDKDNAPYVQEHTDLIESIRKGEPINELKNVAESTLTAIMGRMAAYTGKAVTWDRALDSKLETMPPKLDRNMKLEATRLAVPGKTPLV
ncbi:MAG TPA: Gfo/Idh/MocA family oxidoreductase [Gemmataceae bacterium]|nr:Gfo/Idh/MocA family oxidoreductase [Gemmataceae bacterium]